MSELQTHPAPRPRATSCTTVPCETIALERNLFFTGKLMAARDFRDETAYLRSRIHLHNRLFVGSGVVCGLDVVEHPTLSAAEYRKKVSDHRLIRLTVEVTDDDD